MITYDRRAFAKAFLDAHPDAKDGYYYSQPYNTALREHRQRVLDGLQNLFGVTLDFDGVPDHKPLFMLFRSTANSYLKITAPGDGFGEAGLIYRQLAEAGVEQRVDGALGEIRACNDRSREAHLDVLETLIAAFLGDRAGTTVTSADLAAIGVDDTAAPNSSGYDLWEDY
ncbi:hypothetical protein F4560_007160 [Saccharothrix ecbatanensis]|uniref:Uncharacterized protein n=1 Tax=Saccharothrix ecbatanensis TaxID=1105145 RepID=A0A7W9HRY2_9PSEU|nr:hypothetical protein [Saccharothrix ecbatanensis]MBB5807392.1 hypothetical protein [Saccharothrix ecbatanensis]